VVLSRSRFIWLDCGLCSGTQFQGRSSSSRFCGCPAIRRRTSASQACGLTSLSLAVPISVYMAAARLPPRSEPAKSQDSRPRAIPLSALSAAFPLRHDEHSLVGGYEASRSDSFWFCPHSSVAVPESRIVMCPPQPKRAPVVSMIPGVSQAHRCIGRNFFGDLRRLSYSHGARTGKRRNSYTETGLRGLPPPLSFLGWASWKQSRPAA